MDSWVKDFDSWDICDQVCMNLFDKTMYVDKKIFDWEDDRSKGWSSSIKTMDVYDGILSFSIKSKEWSIKDKAYERNERLEQILPDEKTSE